MGLNLDDFLDLTPLDFLEAKASFVEYNESNEQKKWERIRWLAFHIAAPPKGVGGMLRISDFGTFPWEKDETPEIDLKQRKKRAEDIRDKWNN